MSRINNTTPATTSVVAPKPNAKLIPRVSAKNSGHSPEKTSTGMAQKTADSSKTHRQRTRTASADYNPTSFAWALITHQ